MPNDSAQSSAIVSDERVRNALRLQIATAYNVTRTTTRAELAQASGVNVHTIDQIMSDDRAKHRRICFGDAMSIAFVLGPRAVNALLGLIGWVGRPQDEANALNPMTIAAESMQHLAIIAAAAADGRIDHTEELPTQRAADALIATVLPLSSAGNA